MQSSLFFLNFTPRVEKIRFKVDLLKYLRIWSKKAKNCILTIVPKKLWSQVITKNIKLNYETVIYWE